MKDWRIPVKWVALVVTLLIHSEAMAIDKITYRLKWLINMSTVGDVVAETQGFFKARRLEVVLKPGGPERDAIRELELGYADFGVASADQVIQAAAKGSPVVVVAQLFQVNPLQWMYIKDHVQIDSLADLKNKTIGVTFGKNDEMIMRTLLAIGGIQENHVKLYSVRMDYTPFYRNQVDLWPVYANTQAIEIEQKIKAAGQAVGYLTPAGHGVRFVANSVVVSARVLEEKPELVKRFLDALMAAWRYALDPSNAESVVSAVRRYDRDTPTELMVAQLDATRRLVKTGPGIPIGHIDVPAWEQTEHIMLTYGQIDAPVNVGKRLVSGIAPDR